VGCIGKVDGSHIPLQFEAGKQSVSVSPTLLIHFRPVVNTQPRTLSPASRDTSST
jgi:hypothetical protein